MLFTFIQSLSAETKEKQRKNYSTKEMLNKLQALQINFQSFVFCSTMLQYSKLFLVTIVAKRAYHFQHISITSHNRTKY